jgi:hypothetical protein
LPDLQQSIEDHQRLSQKNLSTTAAAAATGPCSPAMGKPPAVIIVVR